MTRDRMVGHLRDQATACAELGSPLYAELLARVAADVESGGPAADVLRGHEQDPGPSALGLRLLGGVHRMVLERRAPELAAVYPSVGGSGDVAAAWPALRDLLSAHGEELRGRLDQPPQTNEVGRAGALIGALQHVAAANPRPMRLVEIGASAGLNLRADHFRVELPDGGSVGPGDSPVVLRDAWRGPTPPVGVTVAVVERRGCDVAPVDPTTTDGRLLLTSYVWPDQRARLERLRGALDLAGQLPAPVEKAGAADFLDRLDLVEGTTTVIWHSVMWQYLDRAEQRRANNRLDALGEWATAETGLAEVSLEPRRRAPGLPHEFLVVLREWPKGEERVLGVAAPHGLPTTWE